MNWADIEYFIKSGTIAIVDPTTTLSGMVVRLAERTIIGVEWLTIRSLGHDRWRA